MSAKSNERHKENEEMSEYGRPTPNVKVSVTRHFDASPERVFDAWLDPELIGKWMFGPALREEEVLRIVADARVGGSFSFLVRRQGQEIVHVGHRRGVGRRKSCDHRNSSARDRGRAHPDSRNGREVGRLREPHRGRMDQNARSACGGARPDLTTKKGMALS